MPRREDPRCRVVLWPGEKTQCYMCSDEPDEDMKLCAFCLWEKKKIALQCTTARRYGGAADLTFEQWMKTVKDFDWKCAYCLRTPYSVLEHFIPAKLGGGTTIGNCVPACHRCNVLKKNHAITNIKDIPQADLERVAAYLESRKSGEESKIRS